jgi:hypothetical protein
MTLVLKTGLSRLARSQFPKPLPTSPRHKPQNRRHSQTALPKTSAPALPGKSDAKRPFSLPKPLPRQTAVLQPTHRSSPKPAQPTCGATAKTIAVANSLGRKRLRQTCRTTAKQNRPLPTKACTEAPKRTQQPASTLRHLANPATRFLTCDTWRET